MQTAIAPSGAAEPVRRRFEMREEPQNVDTPAAPEVPAGAKPATAEGADGVQNNGEEAPPATPEAKPEEEVTPEQAAKREGRRFERKLDKAYRKAAEAQARAELAEKRIAELTQPKPPAGEPKLEDFDYDPEKYAAAKVEFAKSQSQKEFEAKRRDETVKQARQRLVESWAEKAEKGADKYDDWESVVGEVTPGNPLSDSIMDAENGHDIAHYIGTHPKEAERLMKLQPLSLIREIGKLEAKLLAEAEKPKAPSKAPAPITPLTGAAPVVSDAPSEQDDTKEWIRKRSRQVHGNRRF